MLAWGEGLFTCPKVALEKRLWFLYILTRSNKYLRYNRLRRWTILIEHWGFSSERRTSASKCLFASHYLCIHVQVESVILVYRKVRDKSRCKKSKNTKKELLKRQILPGIRVTTSRQTTRIRVLPRKDGISLSNTQSIRTSTYSLSRYPWLKL